MSASASSHYSSCPTFSAHRSRSTTIGVRQPHRKLKKPLRQPQEEVLRFNSGVESIVSSTSRGQGQVVLNYQLGYDMNQAMLDVINRLNQATPRPADSGEPFVASGGDGGLPGPASILIYAGENNPVEDMIEEVVEPRLSRIPGVAQVNLNARRPKEVSIVLTHLKPLCWGFG